jgi:hypothetical protein
MGIIPLDVANQILATFGIAAPTPVYERRVVTGGFRVDNFADVLDESRFVFVMDDSVGLYEIAPEIAVALAELGAAVDVELDDDDGTTGAVTSPRAAVVIRFDPGAGDEHRQFAKVIRAFQEAAGDGVAFRVRPGAGDVEGDCWIYAVRTPQEWRELDALHGGVIRSFFLPLPPQ